MRTVSNYKRLATIQGDERTKLKALAGAINLDLALPALCMDMLGEKAGTIFAGKGLGAGVRVFAANEPRLPDAERIKGFLAQKWAVPTDTPILADVSNRVESFFHTNMPEIDLGWTNLYQLVDLRGSKQDSFEIIDTNAGITFSQTKPGERVKVRREISEAQTTVKYLTFSDGLGLLDDWLRFDKFWSVEQAVAEFRSKAFDRLADSHYGLFTALGSGINQAFATDDTTTFNAAAATVLRNVRSKGYAAGQNARFWIVCAPEHLGRILRMLEATQGSQMVAFQSAKEPIAYSVAGVIATTYVPSNSTGYYLVLPGRKIQRGNWLDLQIESQRDIHSRATDWIGTMQYNAAIGDSDQVRRVLFT